MSLNRFKYHIRKPDAPKPIWVGESRHPFYDRTAIAQWNPTKRAKSPTAN